MIMGLTLLPFLELRASIPYGILQTNLYYGWVFLIAVVANILLVPFIWFFLYYVIQIFLKISCIDKCYQNVVE